MILTIDIGNSNITIGAYRENTLLFLTRIGTDRSKMPDEYAIALNSLIRLYGYNSEDLTGAIISSVVPPLLSSLKHAIKTLKPIQILTVGPGIKTGLHIAIDNPGQLGADLVAVSVAALEKYPLPSVVIDMGTATTFSSLDRDGKLLGVSILPGLRVSLEALTSRTAQLQQVELTESPERLIGKNTVESIKSGVLFGNASMLDGMIDRHREILGDDMSVIITGGLSSTMAKLCRNKMIQDENLVLEGLRILYEKNTK